MVYIGRAAIQKSTGKLIEFQSGDAEYGTLLKNAINAGFSKDDVEEKRVTANQYNTLITAAKKAETDAAASKKKELVDALNNATTIGEVKAAVKDLIGI